MIKRFMLLTLAFLSINKCSESPQMIYLDDLKQEHKESDKGYLATTALKREYDEMESLVQMLKQNTLKNTDHEKEARQRLNALKLKYTVIQTSLADLLKQANKLEEHNIKWQEMMESKYDPEPPEQSIPVHTEHMEELEAKINRVLALSFCYMATYHITTFKYLKKWPQLRAALQLLSASATIYQTYKFLLKLHHKNINLQNLGF